MSTTQVWILAIIGLGLFIYFVPYKNIKIVHKKLDTIYSTGYEQFPKTFKEFVDELNKLFETKIAYWD